MRPVLVFAIALAVTACSDRSPVAPEHGRLPCRPSPALVAMVTLAPLDAFAPSAMRDALQHGADAMTLEVAEHRHRKDLRDAMLFAVTDINESDFDSACRMVEIADAALNALPDSGRTFPDRDGIRLILALTAHSLDAVIGK